MFPQCQRFAAGVAYMGGEVHGWQKQPQHPSVQECVETALSKVANHTISTVCAGRTDQGVHALGQIIHFDSKSKRTPTQWRQGANRYLPAWVRIVWVEEVDRDFHARFSALSRRYQYHILQHTTPLPFLQDKALHIPQPLDLEAMRQASAYLIGEHDFSSFRDKHCQSHSPFRHLERIEILALSEHLIRIDIQANAFLHHMIRNLMGVLLPIGLSKKPPEWARTVLQAKDRKKGGITAPAHPLVFYNAYYPAPYVFPLPEVPFLGI